MPCSNGSTGGSGRGASGSTILRPSSREPPAAGGGGAAATQAIFQFVEDYLGGDPAVEEIREERLVRVFTAEEWAACRDDVERAVTTFASLIRDGWFFIRVEDGQGGHCSHCDFT